MLCILTLTGTLLEGTNIEPNSKNMFAQLTIMVGEVSQGKVLDHKLVKIPLDC